ncbi:MAG: hypothetical protein L0099_12525 [Acidobacteria bacterium]|nr:hypothetical protein [Acidobacteriota bacterium]
MLYKFRLAERLRQQNAATGGVYSTADLAVLLERPHPARLTEAVNSLLRGQVLDRVRRGLYVDRVHGYRPELLGQRWLAPSCLSCESALDRHELAATGILDYTYVTPRLIPARTQAVRVFDGRRFVYRHLADHLFFGFATVNGVRMAEAEKATLDYLYFTYKGQRSVLAPEDITFRMLDPHRYRRYLTAYRQPGFTHYALRWMAEERAAG